MQRRRRIRGKINFNYGNFTFKKKWLISQKNVYHKQRNIKKK